MKDPLEGLAAQLAELGLDARAEPATPVRNRVARAALRLAHGESTQDYALTYGPHVSLTTAGPDTAGQVGFAYAPYITAKTADSFRRAGVQYVDAAGNAWIQFGDVLIDVRGRLRPAGAAPRTAAAANLFSTGRAQVVFVLLAWPDLWDAPQRELARAAGVSLGQAHNTLALLVQAGYERDERRDGRTGLLDLWVAAFPTGLAQRLTLAKYHGAVGKVKKERADDVVAVSGEAAVPDLLRPTTLTLYVAKLNPRLAIVNRWRSDGEPNIVVRRKFWNDPATPHAPTPGVDLAPWLLVYADLVTSDDPRTRGVSAHYRESHERPR
jgi:hypothetical protein